MIMGDMTHEAISLGQINENLLALRKDIEEVKKVVVDLRDVELEVRPEYLRKLKEIEKGKFFSRKELEKSLKE